jgi:hypothetical protein
LVFLFRKEERKDEKEGLHEEGRKKGGKVLSWQVTWRPLTSWQ